VVLNMRLRRFACMVSCVAVVTMGQMGVMPGSFVPSCFVVLRSFPVMARRVFVMFGCLVMMLCRFLRHVLPFLVF
jgi:hypothetical protein